MEHRLLGLETSSAGVEEGLPNPAARGRGGGAVGTMSLHGTS